jgi:hypothetical protein
MTDEVGGKGLKQHVSALVARIGSTPHSCCTCRTGRCWSSPGKIGLSR